ncbi:uncharacterized protein LOC142632784 [Castanea sativa]|uniref:uncharacterized protein LOC142632784 n=1 Tax=Castanea sativa TaxID=21020 RepID=UPI003F64F0A9
MSSHYFYVYYDGEAYINDLHRLSYRGPNQKQKLIEVKSGIHMRRLKGKIMSTLGLDKDSHDISIVFQAPQQLVGTQVFYNSILLQCDDDVDIMWGVIKRAPQFIGSDLYLTVDPVGFNVDEGSQYANGAGEQELVPVTIVYPSVPAETSLAYNVGPHNVVAMDNIEDTEVLGSIHTCKGRGYTHKNEDIHTYLDKTIEMDDTRDMYEEFIDNDGLEDNLEFLDEVHVEKNVDTCPNPNPIPEWFMSNTWENIHNPSPSLEAGLMSWRSGDELSKGMLFKNKAAVQHVLTMFSVGLNKKFKYMKSDPERLVVTCVHDACSWSVRAICSKRHKMWVTSTCKGPHTCLSLQVDHDGRMMDLRFIAITLEPYVREDISRTIATLQVVAAIYGDFDESYAELPRFLAALKGADPSTVTQLKCDNHGVLGTCTFNCAFWAFGPCIEGFKHCRLVISIDATHLYGKYKGKLLIAMAIEANNEVYLLAFAIVESESKETWGWFLPPKAHHRYCLRHVASNVNTKWKILKLKNLVWRAASANQVRKFEAILELICNVKSAAHRYLEAENKQKWTLAHDEGCRYGAMTTNLSECFNGVLKGARSLPITAMVRFTFFKVNYYFDARCNLTLDQLEVGQEWCKYAMDKFKKKSSEGKGPYGDTDVRTSADISG